MFRFQIRASSLLFAVWLVAHCLSAERLFVSPTPLSDAPGTRDDPCSLERALKFANTTDLREIILLDGIYEPEKTLIFTGNESREKPIVIRAQTRGKAIISGGVRLSNEQDSSGAIQRFPKPDDNLLHNSRDLYIGEARAVRARSVPYYSWNTSFSAIPGLSKSDKNAIDSKVDISPTTKILDYTQQSPALGKWANPQDIEFVFRCAWWEKRCGVNSISDNQITFQEPGWSTINTPWATEGTSRLNAQMPKTTFIEGALELLDSPGEWYNGSDSVHLILPQAYNPQSDEVRLARLETLVRLENTSNLVFKGIVFAHSTWLAPIKTKGYNEGQANHEQIGQIGRTVEAIGLYNSKNIAFENCKFQQLGGWGLGILQSSKAIQVRDCQFVDIAGNGIVIGGVKDEEATGEIEQVSDVTVSKCWIHKPASVYHGGVGIFVGHASRVQILENEISDAPYTGISVGWGWNNFDSTEIRTHGNVISDNHVHHYLYKMYDGGGIYSLGPQSNEADGLANGLRVTQNTIHNQGGIGNILYSDGGSRWITIQDNNSFNNLRELELYYDQKAMYVPDWGGCSPYGDLVFANNTLGNVESRSPNFRCAPQDPEPWANDFELPFNTEYYDNQFTTTHTRSLKKANTSDERHQRVNSFAEGTIKSFSVKGREISFSLSSAGDVIIKRDSTQEKLKLVSSTGNKIDNWLNNELTKVRLPEGEYHIVTLPEDNNLLSSFRTKISSSNANIYQISARTSTVEIETAPYIKTTILTYSRNNHAEKLVLKSQNDTEIAKSESWIDHPYHWQTLRAFIDTNQNLPTPQTRAILSDLPGGSFIIETSERSSTNTIVVTSPQRASI